MSYALIKNLVDIKPQHIQHLLHNVLKYKGTFSHNQLSIRY